MKVKHYILFVVLVSFIFASFGISLEYYYLNYKNMAEPVWGQLAKAQDDDETVEEAITRLVGGHEADAGAHTAAGEALETHKTQVIIDHPADSLVEDKFGDEEISNPKLKKRIRGFIAVVDAAGNYDYTTIQTAINYVNGLGGGKILILNGTYIQTGGIVMYSNITLVGESRDGVIIDFDAGGYWLQCFGSGDDGPAGTISTTTGDKTITGVGSSFTTEIDANDHIKINDSWYEVDSITDNTHLELKIEYQGEAQSGVDYIIATFLKDIQLKNFTVIGSGSAYGIEIKWAINSIFRNIKTSENSNSGLKTSWCADCSFSNIYAIGNPKTGILIDNCQSTYYIGLSSLSNGWGGIQIQGDDTHGIMILLSNASHNGWAGLKIIGGVGSSFIACTAVGNDSHGIQLTVANYCNITNCYSENNGDRGIMLENGGARCKIVSNTCNNNGTYGIQNTNVEHKHIIHLNSCLGNTSGQIQNTSPDSDVDHNITS